MKTIKKMYSAKKNKFLFGNFLILICILIQIKCTKESLCNVKYASDLILPQVVKLLDNNNNPFKDYRGNEITSDNVLYFNERTKEFFNNEIPPQKGFNLGDVLQISTRIFNTWADTECEKGVDSKPTRTEPNLYLTPYDGYNNSATYKYPLSSIPTEAIPISSDGTSNKPSVVRLQIKYPGYYYVEFGANFDKSIDEFNYNNNLFKNDNSTNIGYSKIKKGVLINFEVDNLKIQSKNKIFLNNLNFDDYRINTLEELKTTELYQYMNEQNKTIKFSY